MNKLILIFAAAIIFLTSGTCFAQATTEPVKICITQEAANKAAENVRTIAAQNEKIKVLEEAMKLKDASIAEIRETARRNEADLKEALHRAELEAAEKTGRLIGVEQMNATLVELVNVMAPKLRRKTIGISIF